MRCGAKAKVYIIYFHFTPDVIIENEHKAHSAYYVAVLRWNIYLSYPSLACTPAYVSWVSIQPNGFLCYTSHIKFYRGCGGHTSTSAIARQFRL